jgi:hypothetical protein
MFSVLCSAWCMHTVSIKCKTAVTCINNGNDTVKHGEMSSWADCKWCSRKCRGANWTQLNSTESNSSHPLDNWTGRCCWTWEHYISPGNCVHMCSFPRSEKDIWGVRSLRRNKGNPQISVRYDRVSEWLGSQVVLSQKSAIAKAGAEIQSAQDKLCFPDVQSCRTFFFFFNKGLHNSASTSRDVHSQKVQTKSGTETQQTKVKTRSID